MYSIILLNWGRPNNVYKIVDNMKKYKYIDEIIISNGKEENSVKIKDNKVRVFNDFYINNKYGLDRRFINGLRAKNNDIIIIDDDININENELNKLISEYENNKNRIVGCVGRNMNNGYSFKDCYGDVDIVLTKLIIFQKKLCSLFFICKPLIEDLYKNGVPYGNGEDIFFSYISSLYFNKKNYCLKGLKFSELPQENVAISNNKNHFNYRNNMCKHLQNNRKGFQKFINRINF